MNVQAQLKTRKTRGQNPRPLTAEETQALEKRRDELLAQMKEAAKERGIARIARHTTAEADRVVQVVQQDGAETREALQPLTALVAGDESASLDERIKAKRNQIGFLRAGIREDLETKRREREATRDARVERTASGGPRRKRGGTDAAGIPPQALLPQSSNGEAGPPEGGEEDSTPAPEPCRPDEEEEEASDTESVESVESAEVDAAELEAPGGTDTTVVLMDDYTEPAAPPVGPALSDTESSFSSSSLSSSSDCTECAEDEKESDILAEEKESVPAEEKESVPAEEQKTDGEVKEQQAPSALQPSAWPLGSVYVRTRVRWGKETKETTAAGTRYRFSVPLNNSSLPPMAIEADVYAACQNTLYVHVPATDTVENWTPLCNWTWARVGVVELDALTVARMLRDVKTAWEVPAKLAFLRIVRSVFRNFERAA